MRSAESARTIFDKTQKGRELFPRPISVFLTSLFVEKLRKGYVFVRTEKGGKGEDDEEQECE